MPHSSSRHATAALAALALALPPAALAQAAAPATPAAPAAPAAPASPALLLQKPALSRTTIAFVHGGDLWTVPREGGDARRLTSGAGDETDPAFSPDGSMLAFTGEYEGNRDVYVVPAAGGVPKRLTYHPDEDAVTGWTPDGARVLFRSGRSSFSRYPRLYTVAREGGPPAAVALPSGFSGSYSPDGQSLAYVPHFPAFDIWKRYRGGQTTAVWLARMSDASVVRVPRDNSNDLNPMWVGGAVYFLSDRDGPVSLYAYDTASKQVTRLVQNQGLDLKSASAGPGAIVYEQFGSLHLYDLASRQSRPVPVRVAGDLPSVRPRLVRVGQRVRYAALSPTGVRAAFGARGEVLTVPADKGDARNVTNTTGVMERDPAWSPDGRWIAYLSDEGGEYALRLRAQTGMGEARTIRLGDAPAFYYSPVWSPDSRRIAYLDNRLTLWYVDVASGRNVKVDADTYESPWRALDPSWSPDGRWLTYTKQLENHLRAVFVYSIETGKATQVTDGMSDARFAAFDRDGKHLYFTASTDAGPSAGWLDMSSYDHPVTRAAYVVVLRKDLPSPLLPQSDEEKVDSVPKDPRQAARAAADSALPPPRVTNVRIDLDGIGQRVLALPTPTRNYGGLYAGKAGSVLLLETVQQPADSLAAPTGPRHTVHRYDLATRKFTKLAEGVGGMQQDGSVGEGTTSFRVSANGEKMLYNQGGQWFVASSAEPPKPAQPGQPGQSALRTAEMEVMIDPRAEWRQMYREAWRIQRDFFYDPGFHGLDLAAAERRYAPYVGGVASRADLNYLFSEMLGELSVGHLFVNGGDFPEVPRAKTGLLGADYTVANGRYRFERVYGGENWNPELRAPLTGPGVNVVAGEYLLAVNGRDVRATDDVYSYFEGMAGRSVVLRVGPNPTGAGSREVTVVPVASEEGLRNLAWIEENRRTVDRLSKGRLAYVYLPNTAGAGYTSFNRYYFAQLGREGAVIDERYNGGGSAADYMIDVMRRPLMSYWTTRTGAEFTTPVAAIHGPKALIINEYAGSGGDLLPWLFRQAKLGPLVGKRTWGGLVGIYDYPELMDGGSVTAPRVAFRNLEGEFDVENKGVAPDVEVELDPAAWRAGRDPQLERAVSLVMEALAKSPSTRPKRGPFPNFHTGARAAGRQ